MNWLFAPIVQLTAAIKALREEMAAFRGELELWRADEMKDLIGSLKGPTDAAETALKENADDSSGTH